MKGLYCPILVNVVYNDVTLRVVAEIDEVLSDKETVSYEDLDKLVYMTAVSSNEDLTQFYPVTWIGFRRNVKALSFW